MLLAFALSLAFAQADEPPPPPEVVQAGEAFAGCVSDRLDQAEDGARPEVIADGILEYCRPQQEAMMAGYARWVRGSDMSDAQKTRVLRTTQRNLRGMRSQIIQAIRRDRRGR